MHPMDHLNAIDRQHRADQDAARRAAEEGPPGPPELTAPIFSSWFYAGAIIAFALVYAGNQHFILASVFAVLTGVVFRLVQGILRGLGIASGASALNRGLGGFPLWVLGGALIGALIGASFMVWLDGMAKDIFAPAMVTGPVGAAAGFVIRGLALLFGAGRKA
jgi:hypothetical protein